MAEGEGAVVVCRFGGDHGLAEGLSSWLLFVGEMLIGGKVSENRGRSRILILLGS